MSKITLNDVGNLIDATTAATVINNNSAVIVAAMDKTLSRDGTSPNQMEANLDMNSNKILNLPQPESDTEPVRLKDINDLTDKAGILPIGGNTNEVLTKDSNDNYDVSWKDPKLSTFPSGGTKGKILVKNSNSDGDVSWGFLPDINIFDSVSQLLASTNTSKGVGSVWRAKDYIYSEASPSATDHHVTTAGGVKLYVIKDSKDSFKLKAFNPSTASDLTKAIQAADIANVWLDWEDTQISVTDVISVTLTNPLKWICNGAVITYTGATSVLEAFNIYLKEGTFNQILGTGLKYDGSYKVASTHRYLQLAGSVTTDFYAERLSGTRCIDKNGGGVYAAAMKIWGGFNRVTLVEPEARLIKREVGSTAGANGISIINENSVTGACCREAIIIRPTVSDVFSEDNTMGVDMDGIGLFSNPDLPSVNVLSNFTIIEPRISNVWGRHIKAQVAKLSINGGVHLVTGGPATGRRMPVIASQHGPMDITGGEILVSISCDIVNGSGALVHGGGGAAGGPFTHSWKDSIVSINGGLTVNSAAYLDIDSPSQRGNFSVSNVRVSGPLREFGYVRTNGYDKDSLELDGIIVDSISSSLCRGEWRGDGVSVPARARFFVKNCRNTGTTRPTVVGNVAGVECNIILNEEAGCIGFGPETTYVDPSAASMSKVSLVSRLAPDMTSQTGPWLSGTVKIDSIVLDNNQEYVLPVSGFNSSLVFIKPRYNAKESYSMLCYDDGGIISISSGSSFNITGATTDPGSGTFRVWRDSTTGRPRLKNAGGYTIVFTIWMLG